MFELPAVEWSTTARPSGAWLSEVVATVGLLLVIHGCVRSGREDVVAFAVGLWIGGAYWFTSSTSFANPAVTIARTMSNTFAGIKPSSAPMFIVMQLIGAVIAARALPLPTPARHPDHVSDRPRSSDAQPRQPVARPTTRPRSAAKTLHSEFDDFFSTETIKLFLQTSFDQFADRSTVKNFLPLLAERFARQRLRAPRSKATAPTAHRSCCSRASTTPAAHKWPSAGSTTSPATVAWSGGSEPGSEINPSAAAAMAEVGIDITDEYPKPWTEEVVQAADVVITMGCGDACPTPANATKTGNSTTQPDRASKVRPIRDEIRARVETPSTRSAPQLHNRDVNQ